MDLDLRNSRVLNLNTGLVSDLILFDLLSAVMTRRQSRGLGQPVASTDCAL